MSRRQKRSSKSAGPAERHSSAAAVRIIGGELRGRRIEYGADPRTRPMKDRVREAVFNLLGDVTGMAAIDLFAGTGALGLEALSRGAAAAIFFERHFPTAELIRRNALSFGVAEHCEIIAADTLVRFRRTLALPDLVADLPWLVFCSPPYDFYVSRQDEVLRLLGQFWQDAPRGSIFVVEADECFDFSLLPEPLGWDLRKYPPARVGLAWKTK
ncbi:MAG: RsmD family RNA methyltransferase [Pirellulales bacterium]